MLGVGSGVNDGFGRFFVGRLVICFDRYKDVTLIRIGEGI